MPYLAILIVAILFILFANIRIVKETEAIVVERLGKFHSVWYKGIHVKFPVIDAMVKKENLKEQVADFVPQSVITKDNVSMKIDTVVFYKIFDPKLYAYGVENPMMAIENLTATTLRNIIGELELDETLTSREIINSKMEQSLDEATDPWGIKITRVELKNIMPPADIQESMEKQMRAERERREKILQAEGEKKAAILTAEGEKESAILRAVKDAEAYGIEKLKAAGMNEEQILKLRSYEAFVAGADGQATKIIIPSEIQNLASLAAAVKESAGGETPKAGKSVPAACSPDKHGA